jgi:hypothetical protein
MEDSNIVNGFLLSLFLSYSFKAFVLKRNISTASKIGSAVEKGIPGISSLLNSMYNVQKRLSQYISSFVFNGPANSVAGFFEFNKQEKVISMAIGLLA